MYWVHMSEEADLRVYNEKCDNSTWDTAAQTKPQLVDMLENLKQEKLYKQEIEKLVNPCCISYVTNPLSEGGQFGTKYVDPTVSPPVTPSTIKHTPAHTGTRACSFRPMPTRKRHTPARDRDHPAIASSLQRASGYTRICYVVHNASIG